MQGTKHQKEILIVLEKVGIIGIPLVTRHRRISPQGTGPGGRIRFGDDMLPGIYRVLVPKAQEKAAHEALAAHDGLIKAWIYDKAPMPEACRLACL